MRPVWGVQFHPESAGSHGGERIIGAFLLQGPRGYRYARFAIAAATGAREVVSALNFSTQWFLLRKLSLGEPGVPCLSRPISKTAPPGFRAPILGFWRLSCVSCRRLTPESDLPFSPLLFNATTAQRNAIQDPHNTTKR